MKRKLLLAASLVIAGLSAQAQRINCGLSVAQSGTGTSRIYTLGSPTSVPSTALMFRIYPSSGVTQSGTGTTRTVSYTYGGVYALYLEATNYCTDSVVKTDTVMGPMDCTNTGAYLYASGTGSTRTFSSGLTGSGLAPGYTTTTTYNYGDGTSGSSATHTYTAGGSYTATVTILCSHPSYPSCTKTETRSFSVASPSCQSTGTKSGTGMTRTYTVQTNATNPSYTFAVYDRYNNTSTVFGTTNPFTRTYTQPGYYRVAVNVTGTNCSDTVSIPDTVVGPVNCATLSHSMTAITNPSATIALTTFYLYGTTGFPGYSRTVNYNYGDGTTGTSTTHSYTAAGSYLVTATTLLSHPTYGSCTLTDTATVNIGFQCSNVNAAFTYAGIGTAYSFTNTSITNVPSIMNYSWRVNGVQFSNSAYSASYTFPTSGTYTVSLIGAWMANGVVVCRDTAYQTINVTTTPAPNRIYANALWDSSMNAAGASVKFWLIQYDSTSQMLTAVDSALVAVTNGYNASTIFNNKPAGSYRVKAHMLNQPAAWPTHLLPTYCTSAAYWQYASVINHTGTTIYGNVFMQQGAAVSGPGFIGGLVTQGANKGASTGDPMANKMIFLRDLYGAPVATTLTNGAGQYQFSNLPYGTYTVYPEEINYTTTPSQPITLDAAQPNAQGYNFRQELIARTFDPYFVPAAVRPTSTPGGIELFPNPAQHTLYIRLGSSVISGSLQLFNLTGQLVKTQPVDAAQELQAIATDGLANGTYLLHIPTAEGRQVHTISIRK